MTRFMRLIALTSVGAVAVLAGAFTSPAMAVNATATKMTDSITSTSKLDSFTVGATIAKSKASASDVASGKITVLADNPVKGFVDIKSKACEDTKGPWTNSFKDANGKIVWYMEKVPGRLCPSKASPTGWVKVGGGKTGRNCKNPAKLGKAPGPVVKGPVIFIKSFVNAKVHLDAKATVSVTCEVISGTARAKATATATARARVTISLRAFIKSKGNAAYGNSFQAIASANAKAAAQTECSASPPAPPPVPGPPTTPPCKENCGGSPPCTVNCSPPCTVNCQPTCPPNTNGTPPNCVPGKDGTQGAGEGTPGQPGGPGAGGQPGQGPGPMCRDRVSGDIRPGNKAPDGGCLDQGTGEPTPPPPPPPPIGDTKCIDPATNVERDKKPGEGEDQFGYCL